MRPRAPSSSKRREPRRVPRRGGPTAAPPSRCALIGVVGLSGPQALDEAPFRRGIPGGSSRSRRGRAAHAGRIHDGPRRATRRRLAARRGRGVRGARAPSRRLVVPRTRGPAHAPRPRGDIECVHLRRGAARLGNIGPPSTSCSSSAATIYGAAALAMCTHPEWAKMACQRARALTAVRARGSSPRRCLRVWSTGCRAPWPRQDSAPGAWPSPTWLPR